MKFLNFMPIYLLLLFTLNIWAQDQIDFSAETLNNEEIVFSDIYSNGPTLVNFWALWCKPCRAEMRHLEAIYEKYKEHGFTLVVINQDTPRSLAKVKSYISSHKITFPVITDPNQEIFQQFNGQSIPLSILYNTKGEVIYSHVGYLPGDEIELEAEVKKVLGIAN
jgi:thiol-disulfide isomerase/thioredoxin